METPSEKNPMEKYALEGPSPQEITFGMIKPTGVSRGLIGEILRRIERKGLKLQHLEMRYITEWEIREHYREYVDTDKIEYLAKYMSSGPVVLMIIQGPEAIKRYRQMAGRVSDPGTIRGDFALEQKQNLVHSSDSPEAVDRELEIFFPGRFN